MVDHRIMGTMDVKVRDDGEGTPNRFDATAKLGISELFCVLGINGTDVAVEGYITFSGFGATEEEARQKLSNALSIAKPEITQRIAIMYRKPQ
jgi:hypothetical protein